MRRREPGSAAGPSELEALDPLTGESLSHSSSSSTESASPSPSRSQANGAARAVRRRRLSRLLAVLAVGCGAAATYFGVTIAQLRDVERIWRTALAFDAARADGDDKVRAALAEVVGDDDDAAQEPLKWIGDETGLRLSEAEQELADRRILDSKVSALRDEMRAALQFRRFQLTPQRTQMGDTPLRKVDDAIDAQLDRWGLAPVRSGVVTLRSIDRELATLRKFTDEPTRVTLLAVTPNKVLVTIDVDESSTRRRDLGPAPIFGVFPAPGGAAVWDGTKVTVYPADDKDAPLTGVPASRQPFEVGDGSGDLWIVQDVGEGGATVVRRFRPVEGATLQEPIPVPFGKHVVGGAAGRLVLVDDVSEALELYSPPAEGEPASAVVLASGPARFLDGDARRVLWQGPLAFRDGNSDGYLHRYEIESTKREVLALPPTDASTGALAGDGTIAVVAGPEAGRIGSILVARASTAALVGVDGPRASVRGNAPQWSADGRLLFWLTPEGRVAMRRSTGREAFDAVASTMRTGLTDLTWLVAVDRR